MLKRKTSLFALISLSFAFIIFMSFLLGLGIEYLNTTRRLPVLLTEVQTSNISNTLSLLYTRQGNWDNLAATVRDVTTTIPEFEEGRALRVVIEDQDGRTLYNSFSELMDSSDSRLVEGKSAELTDYVTGQTLGKVLLFLNEDYLRRKTNEYLISAFKNLFLMTLGAVLIAIIPAAFISRRISSPLTKLTKASREIRSGNLIKIPNRYITSELSELTNSFNRMAESLKRQKKLRQRLVSDLSHEINTPLNIISLDARGIKDGLIDRDEGLESIITEIEKLNGLIKDLDWLAETDAGEITLDLKTCSLVSLIEEEIGRWRFKAEKTGIELVFQNETENMPKMNLDIVRIGQVLSNLLENSIKYAPESEVISIGLQVRDNYAHVSVSDQGPGIPEEEISGIFERFYRLEDSRNRATGGRGLGLSIVQTTMEMHKGFVSVESAPGRGSTFTFSLPLPS